MPDERESEERRPAPPPSGAAGATAFCLTVVAAGVTWLAVLVGGRSTATQGARASTRLRWEQRTVELDAAARRAEAEGKLPHD